MDDSYARGPQDPPLLNTTIGQNFDQTVARFGERQALVSCEQGIHWNYVEYSAEVNRVARALLAAGMVKGDRLAIWSPNRAEWAAVQYATAKVGVVLVTVNPAYRKSELEYVLNQSGARMIVTASEFKGSNYVEMVEEIRSSTPALQRVVVFDSSSWTEFLAAGRSIGDEQLVTRSSELDPSDPINIQYTSGTTGFPKGATLSHRNILNNGYFTGEGCGITEVDSICVPVPFYHCFGMVIGNLAATSHGAAVVLPSAGFEPGAVLKAISEERCTALYGVPTMFIAELEHQDFDSHDLGSLRTGIMAGSPCPVEVMKQVIERMGIVEIGIAYGMTETSPVSTQTSRLDSIERRVGTVGRVGPHVEIRITDPASGLLRGRGESGELQVRGYSVMLGYWDDPNKTAEAIDDQGWMRTGDLADMDDDGYVRIVGRIKDMIIRGGENIYPREIEELLYRHPSVADVQVVGVPNPKLGEAVVAFVTTKAGTEFDQDSLRTYCQEKVAHYKVPAHFIRVDEFPMTVTGKVRKVELRERAIVALGIA